MRRTVLWTVACCSLAAPAFAWGPEGHSIVAEVAHREVSAQTREAVDKLLQHRTLASVSAWADDVKFAEHPETYPWHFTDVPLKNEKYSPADCHYVDNKTHTEYQTCLNTALKELKTQIKCAASEDARRDALRYAVHLVGDASQPLHTVDDLTGGNGLMVKIDFCGDKEPHCRLPTPSVVAKFHEVWDGTLITGSYWSWGSYVDALYADGGWLRSDEAKTSDLGGSSIEAWVNDTHAVARVVWSDALLGPDKVISQEYYAAVKPKLDRQLGIAGLRLARYLDAAFATSCP